MTDPSRRKLEHEILAWMREDEWREDEEQEATSSALAALGARAPGAVVEALRVRVGLEEEGFKVAVAQVLRAIGRPEDADVLELLTSDADPRVRRAAVEGLAVLSTDTSLETLRMDEISESRRIVIERPPYRRIAEQQRPHAVLLFEPAFDQVHADTVRPEAMHADDCTN